MWQDTNFAEQDFSSEVIYLQIFQLVSQFKSCLTPWQLFDLFWLSLYLSTVTVRIDLSVNILLFAFVEVASVVTRSRQESKANRRSRWVNVSTPKRRLPSLLSTFRQFFSLLGVVYPVVRRRAWYICAILAWNGICGHSACLTSNTVQFIKRESQLLPGWRDFRRHRAGP